MHIVPDATLFFLCPHTACVPLLPTAQLLQPVGRAPCCAGQWYSFRARWMFPSSRQRQLRKEPNATPLGPSLFHLTCRVALATAHLFEDRCSNLPGGPVAQWIRHRPTEPGIVGSSPTRIILCGLLCGCFCSRRREPSRADTSLAKNPLLTLTRCPRSLSSSMTAYGGGLFI